jgi:hypothetical protein
MNITPEELLRLQAVDNRERERMWEQTRVIVAALYDVNTKRKVKPTDIIRLSIDEVKYSVEISDEEIEKTLTAWGLKKN